MELGREVAVREPSHEIALLDPHALPGVHLGDEALDLGADVGVPRRKDPDFPPEAQLDLDEQRTDHRGRNDHEGHPPFPPWRRLGRLTLRLRGRGSPAESRAKPVTEANAEEQQEHEQPPRVEPRNELATQPHRDEPEGGERVHEREHAVDDIDRTLSGGHRVRLRWPTTEARERSAEIVEGPPAQVRHAQPVAQ